MGPMTVQDRIEMLEINGRQSLIMFVGESFPLMRSQINQHLGMIGGDQIARSGYLTRSAKKAESNDVRNSVSTTMK